jgi:hypothetical protein
MGDSGIDNVNIISNWSKHKYEIKLKGKSYLCFFKVVVLLFFQPLCFPMNIGCFLVPQIAHLYNPNTTLEHVFNYKIKGL